MLSSSPMYTLHTEHIFATQRATQRRLETLQQLKKATDTEKAAAVAAEAQQQEDDVKKKKAYFDQVLGGLEEQKYSLADFMEYVFNPETQFYSGYDWRWHGFFAHKPVVKRVLGYWSSSRSRTTRVAQESRRITFSGILSKVKKTVNEDFFLNFSLRGISKSLRELSPTAFGIFDAYSSTKRQLKTKSKGFLKRRDVLAGSVALALLNGRSQNNSFAQAVCGTYLMATGAQRQHFSVLHGIGFTMGYSNPLNDIDGGRAPGTLWQLRMHVGSRRAIAATALFLVMYDNINMMVRVAEQILGRKNTQENGTCATKTEAEFFHNNMIHTILRIIVRYGGEEFEHWKDQLDNAQPTNENSTKGNIEVMEAINKELGLDVNDPNYTKYVKILAGDQLTIARQRSILQIADCHGVLNTHFGKPSAGFRSPGSLGFHNTVLDRLPITLTSLPPFRTCRDLIMVSLYARILHCLLLVSKKTSLEEYAKKCNSWDTLKGDMVFENAVLFVRDALLTREFADAIKAGDSGRIVLILKLFAFTYRGNGRTKYAHEMLHVLHNIVNVWSDGLRHTILHNWLLCPTGKANAFVEVDLVQEHLNLWIKKIYKADGDAHSWDWLAFVSPCVDVLRRLATSINQDLGSRQGNKHTIPDLDNDIQSLMASLTEHEVYIHKEVLSAGAAALTHGTASNPLQEFNTQFDQLRRRRELIPVSALTQY
ncbi:hypothetical protein B0H13DRAFT_2241113 [Mycena leptocephala]|nr:hypothetical protein B0H13DRAFT_2241113 [Mycena leptocephala]